MLIIVKIFILALTVSLIFAVAQVFRRILQD